MASIGYDERAFTVDGERMLLVSGAVHYWRSTPSMWPRLLRRSREAGLNCIETYVFWGAHEPRRGEFDFSGRLDLGAFIRLCAAEGLRVVLRIGPYICAEVNFGGFPAWLLEVPDLVTRTDNEPFKREMRAWVERLMSEVGDLQAGRGGPVVLAQLENEYGMVQPRYGDAGQRYVDWVAGLAAEVGIEVPLIMCEGTGGAAIPTLNGFDVASRVSPFRTEHPGVPAFWTECWPGWYDVWGLPHHVRDPRELAAKVIQFFAAGGTAINYYMWHGGTNFGRSAMYDGATTYDFDAPLDEYGRATVKSRHLGRLHAVLHRHANLLLDYERTEQLVMAAGTDGAMPRLGATSWERGELALWAVYNNGQDGFDFSPHGLNLTLPGGSAALLLEDDHGEHVLFESWEVGHGPALPDPVVVGVDLPFEELAEPVGRTDGDPRVSSILPEPVSMLPATRDATDYAWYETTLAADTGGEVGLAFPCLRDVGYVFVDGQFAASGPARLEEDGSGWAVEFRVPLKAGQNRLQVLVAAAGLVKGDWQIGAPQSSETKGLIGVPLVDGVPLAGDWTLTAGLDGEARGAAFGDGDGWRPLGPARRLRWLRARFAIERPGIHVVEVGSLFRGVLFVNGHCLGRYWQQPSTGAVMSDWKSGRVTWRDAGRPTQLRYHVPMDWLRRDNVLVAFEETDAQPDGVRVVRLEDQEAGTPATPTIPPLEP